MKRMGERTIPVPAKRETIECQIKLRALQIQDLIAERAKLATDIRLIRRKRDSLWRRMYNHKKQIARLRKEIGDG